MASLGELGRGTGRKAAKMVAKRFPLSSIRVRALRAAGYDIGHEVYIGEDLHVTDEIFGVHGVLTIGDRAALAQRVLIVLSSHANNSRIAAFTPPVVGRVEIGQDAWIGAGAILLPNVTIGAGAIVAAGSIVTKDVAPGMLVAGNPAREIRPVQPAGSTAREQPPDRFAENGEAPVSPAP
jgi:acetyltransferase-like isoleucine patch superfamily enzyme